MSGNLETNTNGKLKGLSKVLNLRSELHPPLGLEQSQAPYFQGMGNLGSVYVECKRKQVDEDEDEKAELVRGIITYTFSPYTSMTVARTVSVPETSFT